MSKSSLLSFLGRFAIALVLVSGITGVSVMAGHSKFEDEFNSTPTADIPEEVFAPEEKGEPANFLIIGSDTRGIVDNEAEAEAFGPSDSAQLSDVMMVVHVDPDTRTGFVVSFPRDLWVDIPGHEPAKLNAAYSLGGPGLVIETLRENFGVEINHYLGVNFDGFREIVNTIGGVNLFFNTPARDALSGLNIPEPGCRELNGDEALAYARSRHYEAYDAESDRWRLDQRFDLSRIERQQYFMRSLANEALARSGRNLLTAFSLLSEVFDHVERDKNLDLDDLKGLINAFRDLDPASIEMTTVPSDPDRIDGQDALVVRQADAEPILRRLSFNPITTELPEPVAPGEVRVRVLNGSGVRGRGSEVLDAFVAHGFQIVGDAEDAERDDYPFTQVRYAPGEVRKALTVANALNTADVLESQEPLPAGVDVEVIVGRDWDDLDAPVEGDPAPTTDAPVADGQPTTTAPSTSTTTTTRPVSPTQTAYVPVDPETGGPLVGCPK